MTKTHPSNRWLTIIIIIANILLANYFLRWPDLYTYLNTPAESTYLGQASWFDPYDVNLYTANINSGQINGFLTPNPVDSQNTQPIPIYLVYTTLGVLTQSINLPTYFIFHLAGITTSMLLALTLYWVIKQWLPVPHAYYAFTLAYLGKGLGGLLITYVLLPDLTHPHFTLYGSLRNPHDGISLSALLIAIQSSYLLITQKNTRKFQLLSFFSSFITFLIHPFLILVVGTITASWIAYHWYKHKKLQWPALVPSSIAFGLYYLLIGNTISGHPSTAGLQSSQLPSPHIFSILGGLALLLPFIFIALKQRFKKDSATQYLTVWLCIQAILIYVPISYQRLLIRGFWVAAVLLAFQSLPYLQTKFTQKTINRTLIILTSLSLITNITIMRKTIDSIPTSIWTYAPASTEQVFHFLNQQPSNNILALAYMGNLIPAHSHFRTWIGHEFTTPQYNQRLQSAIAFYQGQLTETQAQQLLITANTSYILWGPDEQYAAQSTTFPYPQLVESVFQNPDTKIYKLK